MRLIINYVPRPCYTRFNAGHATGAIAEAFLLFTLAVLVGGALSQTLLSQQTGLLFVARTVGVGRVPGILVHPSVVVRLGRVVLGGGVPVIVVIVIGGLCDSCSGHRQGYRENSMSVQSGESFVCSASTLFASASIRGLFIQLLFRTMNCHWAQISINKSPGCGWLWRREVKRDTFFQNGCDKNQHQEPLFHALCGRFALYVRNQQRSTNA